MTKKTRNWLIALCILAFPFALFLGCLIFLAEEPLPPLAPLPNPNGYVDLVKASKMIEGDVWDYDTAGLEKLRGIVSTNARVLALARITLTNQCAVPLQFTQAFQTNRIEVLVGFKSLAQAFVCEGELAEKENRFGDAARSYLDTIRLGSQITHGGLLIDELVGISAAWYGECQFQGIVTNLDAPSCRSAAATLEMLAAGRQTLLATMQQEEAWLRRTYGWRGDWYWLKWIHYSARQENLRRVMDAGQRESRLMIDLAVRAYELDKGKTPASLAELVPDYLKAVPQDPFTGTNMVHLP